MPFYVPFINEQDSTREYRGCTIVYDSRTGYVRQCLIPTGHGGARPCNRRQDESEGDFFARVNYLIDNQPPLSVVGEIG